MNKKISKLSNDLINKIAAGEVVERPSSVVKELVENSLDAGATKVHVELKNGGLTYIKILDDGSGVAKEDFDLLFERHATSKIQSLTDLENNYNLGFRGEALASIASVSQIKFMSFPKDKTQQTGYQIDQDGVVSQVAMQEGTQVIISDIFYNVPARKKYLKSELTEYKQCLKILEEYALCHPEVEFELIHNQKNIFKYPQSDKKTRISQIYGVEFADKLLEVFYSGADTQIRGFIGRPELATSKNPHQFFLINKRPIKANSFNFAVKQAFGSLIFPQDKPQFFLWIDLNPADVDMNVHPRKIEARFHFEGILFRNILKSVQATLQKVDLTKTISPQSFTTESSDVLESTQPSSFKTYPKVSFPQQSSTKTYKSINQNFDMDYGNTFQTSKQTLTSYYEERKENNIQNFLENEPITDRLEPLLQINKSYILCQTQESLVIIDQHAAHERVLYEKLKSISQAQIPQAQPLLTPIHLDLTKEQKLTLEQSKEILEKLGFSFSDLGGLSLGVNSIPAKFTKLNLQELILGLLDDINSNSNFQNLSDLEDIVINYAACRGAIKFGQLLTKDEMIALIREMELIQDRQYSCPHGRPSKIEITFQDLDKQFKRVK